MSDVSYELLKEAFERLSKNEYYKRWFTDLYENALDYDAALEYSTVVSDLTRETLRRYSAEIMSETDAYGAIIELLRQENYGKTADFVAQVQRSINKKAEIGLKEQVASFDGRDASAIANELNHAKSGAEFNSALDKIGKFTDQIVDETLQKNISFQGRAGLRPQAVRIAERGACEWCRNLAGTYEYPVPGEVFSRHDRCKCILKYNGDKLKTSGRGFVG